MGIEDSMLAQDSLESFGWNFQRHGFNRFEVPRPNEIPRWHEKLAAQFLRALLRSEASTYLPSILPGRKFMSWYADQGT